MELIWQRSESGVEKEIVAMKGFLGLRGFGRVGGGGRGTTYPVRESEGKRKVTVNNLKIKKK